MACCAIRRMPCGKSLISTPSYPVPSVFSMFFPQSLCNKDPLPRFVLQTKNRLARIPWNLNFGWKNIRNIDWKHWEFTDSPDSRWEKGWNLYEWIRMNMKLQPMTLSRSRAWRGLQVGKAPGYRKSQDFECCFQLQTLSALQVTLNYPFVQWNSNKTTFIPMPGCVSQMSPEVLPPPVLQDVPLQVHLPKKTPNRKSKWGREKKTWNGECITPGTTAMWTYIVVNLASWWMWTLIHIAWQKAFCRSFFWLATASTVSSTPADFPASPSHVMLQLLLPRHWNHGSQRVARHNVCCSELHAFIPGHRPPYTYPIQ